MQIAHCYVRPMTSTEGLIASLVEMKGTSGELTLEQASFLITSLYRSIECLVAGDGDLVGLSIASHLFQEFGRTTVEAAITPVPTQDLDEAIAYRNERYGEDAVLQATAVQQECEDAWRWNLELRSAFREFARIPEAEQTLGSMRDLFIRSVNSRNNGFAAQYPRRRPLLLDELRSVLRDLH